MTKKNRRETLFVWDGILNRSAEEGDDPSADEERLRWEGTWVGCDRADATMVPIPKRGAFDEFVSSEHGFEVEGTVVVAEDDAKENGDSDNGDALPSLLRVSMTSGAGYDLGDGSNKRKHSDDRHDVYFSSPNLRWNGNLVNQLENMVFALGENEFGAFVSVGWLRVGNRVTLARRYLDEGDERAGWDVGDLRRAVLDQISAVGEDGRVKLRIPPWQCAAMHAVAGRAEASKRRKIEDE